MFKAYKEIEAFTFKKGRLPETLVRGGSFDLHVLQLDFFDNRCVRPGRLDLQALARKVLVVSERVGDENGEPISREENLDPFFLRICAFHDTEHGHFRAGNSAAVLQKENELLSGDGNAPLAVSNAPGEELLAGEDEGALKEVISQQDFLLAGSERRCPHVLHREQDRQNQMPYGTPPFPDFSEIAGPNIAKIRGSVPLLCVAIAALS